MMGAGTRRAKTRVYPTEARREKAIGRSFAVMGVGTAMLMGGSLFLRSSLIHEGPMVLASLALTSLASSVVVADLDDGSGRLRLSFENPLLITEVFFGLYYLVPLLALIWVGSAPARALAIAACFFLGLMGLRLSFGRDRRRARLLSLEAIFSRDEATAAMVFGLLGAGIVIVVFLLRAAEGSFFTHGDYYEQEMTLGAGLRDVFGAGLQLPILLILGTAGASVQNRHRVLAWRLAVAFAFSMGSLLALSSQTRPVLTAMALTAAVWATRSGTKVRPLQAVSMGLAAVLVVVFVLRVRRFSEDFRARENQLEFAVSDALSLALIDDREGAVGAEALGRSAATVEFLDLLMTTVPVQGLLLTAGVGEQLSYLVPRVLWPTKPGATKPATAVLIYYGIPVFDAPFGPVLEGFARGGWIGVAVELWVFGGILRWLTAYGRAGRGGARFVFFAFMFGSFLNFEDINLIGLLGYARTALVGVIVYKALLVAIQGVKMSGSASSAARPRLPQGP